VVVEDKIGISKFSKDYTIMIRYLNTEDLENLLSKKMSIDAGIIQ